MLDLDTCYYNVSVSLQYWIVDRFVCLYLCTIALEKERISCERFIIRNFYFIFLNVLPRGHATFKLTQ